MSTFLIPDADPAFDDALAAGLAVEAVQPQDPPLTAWASSPWLASDPGALLPFLAIPGFKGGRLLSLSPVGATWRPILDAAFGSYLAHSGAVNLGPIAEVLAILASPDARGRAIAVAGAPRFGLTMWRGDLSSVALPAAMFPPTPAGLAPDFEHPFVTDGGQTIALGEYEAAVDVLLDELGIN